jgi:hypothetical protein
MAKSPLAQMLVDVKITDAAVRRSKNMAVKPYEAMTDAVTKLYEFLRSKPIGEIERLCR